MSSLPSELWEDLLAPLSRWDLDRVGLASRRLKKCTEKMKQKRAFISVLIGSAWQVSCEMTLAYVSDAFSSHISFSLRSDRLQTRTASAGRSLRSSLRVLPSPTAATLRRPSSTLSSGPWEKSTSSQLSFRHRSGIACGDSSHKFLLRAR